MAKLSTILETLKSEYNVPEETLGKISAEVDGIRDRAVEKLTTSHKSKLDKITTERDELKGKVTDYGKSLLENKFKTLGGNEELLDEFIENGGSLENIDEKFEKTDYWKYSKGENPTEIEKIGGGEDLKDDDTPLVSIPEN